MIEEYWRLRFLDLNLLDLLLLSTLKNRIYVCVKCYANAQLQFINNLLEKGRMVPIQSNVFFKKVSTNLVLGKSTSTIFNFQNILFGDVYWKNTALQSFTKTNRTHLLIQFTGTSISIGSSKCVSLFSLFSTT